MAEFSEEQEQRIAYLRERGVEIEFPSDRNKTVDNPDKADSAINQAHVKIVKIPCNDSEDYKEISIPIDASVPGDQLPQLLRVFFNRGSVQLEDVKAAAAQQFSSSDVTVSQQTIDELAVDGSVELFPLSYPNEHNAQCQVSLYLDEVGQLKYLPPNARARALAATCGFKEVPLVGDMFIGRTGPTTAALEGSRSKPMTLTNLDFSLAELDSGAAWLRGIEQHNYEYGVGTNRVAMGEDASNELAAGPSIDNKLVTWSETEEYVEVSVQIPTEITTFVKKDIEVRIQARSVAVNIRNNTGRTIAAPKVPTATTAGAAADRSNDGGDDAVLVEIVTGQLVPLWITGPAGLQGSISTDDSTWCINNHAIELSLEKSMPGRWGALEAR